MHIEPTSGEPAQSSDARFAPLPQLAILYAAGPDARAFLHAQLSNDVEHLPPQAARRAGYCTPKGRLLASFLVIPHADGFLLQVAGDIAAAVAKRLTMYILRSKVSLSDASGQWAQYGVWGSAAAEKLTALGFPLPAERMGVAESKDGIVVRVDQDRFLILGAAQLRAVFGNALPEAPADLWTLADVRAGWPLISLATQDQFVPQMANFELIGGIDFKKGCYPGQEIVARSQYLGAVKRRMYRGEIDGAPAPQPAAGQDLYGPDAQAAGMVVNAAARPEGGFEVLAVLQSAVVESGGPIRLGSPAGSEVRIAALPYAL